MLSIPASARNRRARRRCTVSRGRSHRSLGPWVLDVREMDGRLIISPGPAGGRVIDRHAPTTPCASEPSALLLAAPLVAAGCGLKARDGVNRQRIADRALVDF